MLAAPAEPPCPAVRPPGPPVPDLLFASASLLAAIACVLSLALVGAHLANYTSPRLQRPITRILLMVPIYAVCSLVSLAAPQTAVFLEALRDAYEGFVVYNFFVLCLEYLAPDMRARLAILAEKPSRRLPPPMCCVAHDPSDRHFLSLCKIGILQYVAARIATSLAGVAMHLGGIYCPESMSPAHGHFYTTVANSLSVGLAMFTLFSLYLPIRHDISQYRPVWQFFSIKFVIFLQFWLGIFIKILSSNGAFDGFAAWPPADVSIMVQSMITIIEMAIAATIHVWAFDYRPYISPDGRKTSIFIGLRDSFYWLDLWHDAVFIVGFIHRRLRRRYARNPKLCGFLCCCLYPCIGRSSGRNTGLHTPIENSSQSSSIDDELNLPSESEPNSTDPESLAFIAAMRGSEIDINISEHIITTSDTRARPQRNQPNQQNPRSSPSRSNRQTATSQSIFNASDHMSDDEITAETDTHDENERLLVNR